MEGTMEDTRNSHIAEVLSALREAYETPRRSLEMDAALLSVIPDLIVVAEAALEVRSSTTPTTRSLDYKLDAALYVLRIVVEASVLERTTA